MDITILQSFLLCPFLFAPMYFGSRSRSTLHLTHCSLTVHLDVPPTMEKLPSLCNSNSVHTLVEEGWDLQGIHISCVSFFDVANQRWSPWRQFARVGRHGSSCQESCKFIECHFFGRCDNPLNLNLHFSS